MKLRELTGLAAVKGSIRAAQACRLRYPVHGVWEAADLAWWWRQPRSTDAAMTRVWSEDGVPVRAVRPIAWEWGVSVELVGVPDAVPANMIADAIETSAAEAGATTLSIASSPNGGWHEGALVRELLSRGWFLAGDLGGGGWTSTAPERVQTPEDTAVRSVAADEGRCHHMADRIGANVQNRLGQTGLYDARFDLVAVIDGDVVGNALGWLDMVTSTGFVEPVDVDAAHRRRGVATALVSDVVIRLMAGGAQRVRINWDTGGAAEELYRRLGFSHDIQMSQLGSPHNGARS